METLIFIFATMVAVLSTLYFYAMSQVAYLKANWTEYRCNPIFMPLAGLVGQDVFSNFSKCTMKNFSDYTGYVMDPIMSEFNTVNSTLGEIGGAMNSMRGMMSSVRGGFVGIIGTVFGKIQNLMSQFHYSIIRMRTIMGRITGVMMSFVMLFQTGMETGLSVNNGPIMSAMRFLCFSPETLVKTNKTREFIKLKDVRLGNVLHKNSYVTSVYRISGKGVDMYDLYGVIVSGSHKVRFGDSFISVKDHPLAKKADEEPYLICLNTTTNRIYTAIDEYLDFVESDDPVFNKFKREYIETAYNTELKLSKQFFTNTTTGVSPNTIIPLIQGEFEIRDVNVGDILENGQIIKGVVAHAIRDRIFTSISNYSFVSPNTWIISNNKIIPASDLGSHFYMPINGTRHILYQLITESSMYPIVVDNGNRIMILDELESTESHYHAEKDAIITSGRFRGKEIVV